MKPSLPLSKQIAYAIGQWGWATLLNILSITLVYFYLPPKSAGLPPLVTDASFLYVLNAITIIAAGGRLFEALFCPVVASWSDGLQHPRGRRMPIMFFAAIPAAVACAAMFSPPDSQPSMRNLIWLIAAQGIYSIAFVLYTIPHNALLIELGQDASQRLRLSIMISVTFALGVVLGAQVPELARLLQHYFDIEKVKAFQYAVAGLCALAACMMLVPPLFINEKKYSTAQPSALPMWVSFRATLGNIHFRRFVFSDFAYWTGFAIVETGFLYYLTVLLGKDETFVSAVMPLMLFTSFILYPMVQVLAKRFSIKWLIQSAFIIFSGVFGLIYFLGKIPISENIQVGIVILVVSLPAAFLGILPNTVVAEISELDTLQNGVNREAMYFAVRGMLMKIGQTVGVLIFASMLNFGREPGNDFGIRITSIWGAVLMVVAIILFLPYQEKYIRKQINQLKNARDSV